MTARTAIGAMFFVLAGLLLTGCAVGPRLDSASVDTQLTPSRAVAMGKQVSGRRVLWGGVIVSTTNLKHSTRIEVLGYPLDRTQRPQTDAHPLGRFLVDRPGYLESADYASGRLITLTGAVTGLHAGHVGQARYVYAVVVPDHLYLWPADSERNGSGLHFGIGVLFHN
ncbi:MAG: Slp family lipoprotein [Gammaproteobacteria bacterium]